MITWQQELRNLLNEQPGADKALLDAIDGNKIENNWCHCYYGTVANKDYVECGLLYYDQCNMQSNGHAFGIGQRERYTGASWSSTPLENMIDRTLEVRSEIIAWMAEHGSAKEADVAVMA